MVKLSRVQLSHKSQKISPSEWPAAGILGPDLVWLCPEVVIISDKYCILYPYKNRVLKWGAEECNARAASLECLLLQYPRQNWPSLVSSLFGVFGGVIGGGDDDRQRWRLANGGGWVRWY